MKVVLLQDVKGQGKKDDLIEVSDGYARNFLLPRKLAVVADAAILNDIKNKEAARLRKIELEKADAGRKDQGTGRRAGRQPHLRLRHDQGHRGGSGGAARHSARQAQNRPRRGDQELRQLHPRRKALPGNLRQDQHRCCERLTWGTGERGFLKEAWQELL